MDIGNGSVAVLRLSIKPELTFHILPCLLIKHGENLSPAFCPTLYLTLSIASLFVSFSKHSPTLNYNVSHCREERYCPTHPLQDAEGGFHHPIRGYATNLMPDHEGQGAQED